LFHEEEEEEVGMEYLVYLVDVGIKFFYFFGMTRRRWGCKFFRTKRRSEWNVLRMWGLRRRRRI
jgi:hypothetical protein